MSSFKKVYSDQFNVKNINYGNGLNFLIRYYKRMTCIDFNKQYETLLMLYLEKDFTNSEILFLKNGIQELFKAKLFLDRYTQKDKNYFYNKIYEESKNRYQNNETKANPDEDANFIPYANQKSEKQAKEEFDHYEISKELIKTELLIFKTKIERLGYIVHFRNEEVEVIQNNQTTNQVISDKSTKVEEENKNPIYVKFKSGLSKKGQKLLDYIMIDTKSLIDIIDFIDENTNENTKQLLINEIKNTYELMRNEFMFHIEEKDIEKAIDFQKHNLEYIYVNDYELKMINPFVKNIGNTKVVWNVSGLSFEEKENSQKLVYLNNLMIDYYDGIFTNEIPGFENINHYRNVYEYLNKSKRDIVSSSTNNNLVEDKVTGNDITYIDSIYLEHKDILPPSILKAYKEIGKFKSLYINENGGEILNSYVLGPFDSLPGETILEYYCLEENYLNLLSKIEDKTFIFFDNRSLDLYLYEYAKAFNKGYNDFEKNLNKKQKALDETQEQKALKIFSYVLNAKYKNGYFGDITDTYEQFKDKKGRYVGNDEFSEWGFLGGQFYKAWEIILNNPIVFEPLFLKYYNSTETNKSLNSENTENNNNKKFPAKYHALTYILELLAKDNKPPIDTEGNFKKDEIVKIGMKRCNDTGQNFYNFVKNHHELVSKNIIKKTIFKPNWKEIVLQLTQEKEAITTYIKNNNL
jgi:hypothetical protein